MNRRVYISSFLTGCIAYSGCVRVDTQPDQVPIRVDNRTGREHEVGVECIERGQHDPLISTEITLRPNESDSIYAEPIAEGKEYIVTIQVDDNAVQESISGGGLRDIDVVIQSEDDIQINRIDT